MDDVLLNKSREIFNCKFEKCDSEKKALLQEKARRITKDYNWPDIFNTWYFILKNDCKTEGDVINFVALMVHYLGFSIHIPYPNNPYDFLGYIYSRIDLEKNWNNCGDLLDSLAICILENNNELDLLNNPEYKFWEDPKIIEIANKYGKK